MMYYDFSIPITDSMTIGYDLSAKIPVPTYLLLICSSKQFETNRLAHHLNTSTTNLQPLIAMTCLILIPQTLPMDL